MGGSWEKLGWRPLCQPDLTGASSSNKTTRGQEGSTQFGFRVPSSAQLFLWAAMLATGPCGGGPLA